MLLLLVVVLVVVLVVNRYAARWVGEMGVRMMRFD